jgi:hypothetical protein
MKRDVLIIAMTFAAGAGFGCNGAKLVTLLVTSAVAAVQYYF